jgi:hypothetical protein
MTAKQQILKTSNNIISALKEDKESDFDELIGVKLHVIAKDDEMLHRDYMKIRKYVQKYTSFDKLYVKITDQYDDVGKLRVEIPIFKGNDSIDNIKEIQLNIFFGPPQFVPLNKISGYELIIK